MITYGDYEDLSISDANEGSLVLMTCEEFESKYPHIAQSQNDDSYDQPQLVPKRSQSRAIKKQDSCSHTGALRRTVSDKVHAKVRVNHKVNDYAGKDKKPQSSDSAFDEQPENSNQDESSSYRV